MWPDGRQCFVNLQDRPGLLLEPTRIIDLHVADLSDQHSHLDVRRHGTPIVLHDPDGLLVLEEEDVCDGARRPRSTRCASAGSTGEWLVNRAIARGHVAEAVDFYLRFALGLAGPAAPRRALSVAPRLRAALPARGPARRRGRPLEALVPGQAPPTLEELSLRCFAWLDELLDR